MMHRPDLAEIRQAAHRPQLARLLALVAAIAGSSASSFSTARSMASGAGEKRVVAPRLQAGDEFGDAGEIQPPRCASKGGRAVGSDVLFDRATSSSLNSGAESPPRPRVPKLPSRWWRPARPAICAISAMVSRRSRRPSNFSRPAKATWARPCSGPCRSRRWRPDIDLPALEHCDLGVAGGRRQRAHHHRRAALEAAQHLGQRVNLLGGEGRRRRIAAADATSLAAPA